MRDLDLPPEALAAGAGRVLTRIAEQKVAGGDDRYAHTDLSDFQGNLESSRKIVDLLRPLVAPAQPAVVTDIDAKFAQAQASLDRFREGDGFVSYDRLSADERAAIAQQMRELAAAIGKLRAALGLS